MRRPFSLSEPSDVWRPLFGGDTNEEQHNPRDGSRPPWRICRVPNPRCHTVPLDEPLQSVIRRELKWVEHACWLPLRRKRTTRDRCTRMAHLGRYVTSVLVRRRLRGARGQEATRKGPCGDQGPVGLPGPVGPSAEDAISSLESDPFRPQ